MHQIKVANKYVCLGYRIYLLENRSYIPITYDQQATINDMIHEFTEENIVSIESVVGSSTKKLGDDVYGLELTSEDNNKKMVIEIYVGLEFENKRINMVLV